MAELSADLVEDVRLSCYPLLPLALLTKLVAPVGYLKYPSKTGGDPFH